MKSGSDEISAPHVPVRSSDLRASERVLRYLLSEFESPELQDGARLPSNKELAKRLNVSTPTVHSVIRQLVKEGRVRTRRGSGTYLVAALSSPPVTQRIMIATPLNELEAPNNTWDSLVGAGIFQATLAAGNAISLEGLTPELTGDPDALPQMLISQKEKYAGMIVLPFSIRPEYRHIVDLYEQSGKPVIHLYPPSIDATANFVSPDFAAAHHKATQAFIQAGRRRVVYLSPHRIDSQRLRLHSSVGFLLRLSGISSALALHRLPSPQLIPGVDKSEQGGYEAMQNHLRRCGQPPDLLVGTGDLMTIGAALALRDAGLEIPRDVSVISGTGIDLSGTAFPNMTHLRPNLRRLGMSLIEMLLERIRLGGSSIPGCILPFTLYGGNTTSAEENRLLSAALSN